MSTKKIYTNTLAQIFWKLLTAFISIYMLKILADYLGVEGFWMYSSIYNYLSIFATIADLGLYTIGVRELAKVQNNPEKIEKISGNILSLRAIFGVGTIVISLAIAPFINGYAENIFGIFIVSIFTVFGLLNSSLMTSLQASLRAEISLLANPLGKMTTFLLICAFAYYIFPEKIFGENSRLIFVLVAGLVGNIVMTGITFWYLQKQQKVRFHWDFSYILHILKLSLPYGIALFLWVIFFKIDILLLQIMESELQSKTSIALYSAPMKIVDVGMMYGTIFLNSFLPILTQAIHENKIQETRLLSAKCFELLVWFGVAISVFLAFFAKEVIVFIYNNSLAETTIYSGFSADLAMKIVAWIFLFYFISSLTNYILIAKNQQKKIIYINLCIAVVNIVGNILLIPQFSFIWAAFVTLASQILLVIISSYFIRQELSLFPALWKICYFLMWAIFAVFLALWSKNFLHFDSNFITLATSGMIFGTVYLFGWFLLRKFAKK